MKKIFFAAAAVIAGFMITACANTGMPDTADDFISAFNKCAADTDYALGAKNNTEDGTINIATRDEDTIVYCTEIGGELSEIDITGNGIFQPQFPAYDYMIYAVMSCDKSLDYTASGDLIASMYYEAYVDGEPVIMAYDGIQYSFYKGAYDCRLVIDKAEE